MLHFKEQSNWRFCLHKLSHGGGAGEAEAAAEAAGAAAQSNSITYISLINRVVVGITLKYRVVVGIKHIGNLYWMLICFCCFRASTYKQKFWLNINFNANCSAAHKTCSLFQAHWFGTYMSWIMPTKIEWKKYITSIPSGFDKC